MAFVESGTKVPPDDTQLWRYMEFAKFMDLIMNSQIYLAPISSFLRDDPWEGSVASVDTFHYGIPSQAEMDQAMQSSIQLSNSIRNSYFLNCWHINDDESDAQWKIYGPREYSLAVVTTFGSLKFSLTDDRDLSGGVIEYVDILDFIDVKDDEHQRIIRKRRAFAHEKEFRLFHQDKTRIGIFDTPSGLFVKVDCKKLIERVVISPLAPDWFVNNVRDFLGLFGLEVDVRKSDLLNGSGF